MRDSADAYFDDNLGLEYKEGQEGVTVFSELSKFTPMAFCFSTGGVLETIREQNIAKIQSDFPEQAINEPADSTSSSTLSARGAISVGEYRKVVGEDDFVAIVQKDCEERLEDVRRTNKVINSLSAFLSIPTLIGYLAKLACCRNEDFLYRNNFIKAKTGLAEEDFKKVTGIDGKSYLEFVNRYMLQYPVSEWGKDNGIARVLYGILRCGLLHGQTLGFNRKLKNSSYNTTSPTAPTTEKHMLERLTCKITHNVQYSRKLAELENDISGANGAAKDLIFCADSLCDAIKEGIDSLFREIGKDSYLKQSVCNTFEREPPICFVDFDAELAKEKSARAQNQ